MHKRPPLSLIKPGTPGAEKSATENSGLHRNPQPEGKPAAGTAQIGLTGRGAHSRDQKDLPEGVVKNLYPGEERTVMFRDQKRKLGKVIRVGAMRARKAALG